MRLILTRYSLSSKACLGRLQVYDGDAEVFRCYTLEESSEGTERGKDLRIPEGYYKLRRHSPSRFENTLRDITGNGSDKMINVYNGAVPADRCILIHWGNSAKDTQGCILLGKNKVNDGRIGESRAACKQFYDIMRDVELASCELKIINAF